MPPSSDGAHRAPRKSRFLDDARRAGRYTFLSARHRNSEAHYDGMSHEINELAAALAKAAAHRARAQRRLRILAQNQKTGKASKYADLAAVWEAYRAPLAENDLAVSQLPTDAEPAGSRSPRSCCMPAVNICAARSACR